MNIKKMSDATINLFRQIDAKNQVIWKEGAHLTSAYTELDVHSAELAKACGMIRDEARAPEVEEGEQKRTFLLTLRDFILIGSLQNWNDVLEDNANVSDIKQMKRTESIESLYLAMKNMLLRSYYEKSKTGFKHAWGLFLKFSFGDLGLNPDEIETELLKQNSHDLNLITK